MFSFKFKAAAMIAVACLANSAMAAGYPGQGYPQRPVQQASASGAVSEHGVGYSHGMYPQLNAPLYPAPVQYVPEHTGGAVITNQAFAPHEMLYPHDYHAMYPPFYHKVVGKWIWTPFGMRQHEHWELQGTEVNVKYRAQRPLFSGFHPPVHR